ncbi:MAG TPA: methyltransferase regulatory domain-containing protein [Xenococcaceae cyanobacterium]
MENWSEGYVVDIDYTYSFFEELNPAWIAFALTQRGIAPPNYEKFNYCELGFGQGFGTNLFAAIHPQGEFWATDFNPSHACHAKLLANEAGCQNVHFFDKSFAEFLDTETPQFDFIVLHGIYSWVGVKNQEIIVEIIRRKLKFGGAVYISYNTLPGWIATLPLQKLMLEYAEQSKEPTINRIDRTISFIEKLKELDAGFFSANPILEQQINQILQFRDSGSNYLIHEYFTQHWQPLYFFEVAQKLAEAKVTFATSAIIGDQYFNQRFNSEQLKLLAEVNTPELRETVRDYFINQYFRKDIFVKGIRKLSASEQAEILSKFRFTLAVPYLEEIKYQVDVARVKITLDEAVFTPLVTELYSQALTIEELLEKPTIKENVENFTNALDVLTLLIAVGYVKPLLPEREEIARQDSIEKFNLAVLERSRYGSELKAIASPLIGSGVEINRLEQLFLLAYKRQIEPSQFVYEVLQRGGQKLKKEDKVLETEAETKTELQERWHYFKTNRLPILEKWLIV